MLRLRLSRMPFWPSRYGVWFSLSASLSHDESMQGLDVRLRSERTRGGKLPGLFESRIVSEDFLLVALAPGIMLLLFDHPGDLFLC